MSQWTTEDPGEGDWSAAHSAAQKVTSLSTAVISLRDAITAGTTNVSATVWGSGSGDAFRASLQKPAALCNEMTTEFAAAQSALSSYSDAVHSIAFAVKRAENSYNTARAQWQYAAREAEEESLFGSGTGSDLFRQEPPLSLGDAVRRGWRPWGNHHSYQTMADAISRLKALAAQRTAADNALIAALAPPASQRWTDAQAALAAIGITRPDALNAKALADAYKEIAQRVASGEGSAQDAENLSSFLNGFGDDERTMSAFFEGLDGRGTAFLIDSIGRAGESGGMDPALALALAIGLRHGLSVGSRNWNASEAERFASDMMLVGGSAPDSVAWFFGTPGEDPMGPELTVAMATEIDAWERGTPGTPFYRFPPGGGTWLADQVEAGGGERPFVEDLAARVFSTLGQYPDEALDWLTDDTVDTIWNTNGADGPATLSEVRLKYWFELRDWSTETGSDGFEGIGDLWHGVVTADDGRGFDTPLSDAQIDVSREIIARLADNFQFHPDRLTDAGRESLAEAVRVLLPDLTAEITGSGGRLGSLDEAQIGRLFGGIGEPLRPAVDAYIDELLTSADSADDERQRLRAWKLRGFLDGSIVGEELFTAGEKYKSEEAQRDLLLTAIGYVPGGNLLTDIGVEVLDRGSADQISADYEAAVQEALQKSLDVEDAYKEALLSVVREHDLLPGRSPAEIDEIVGDWADSYADAYGSIENKVANYERQGHE